MLGMFENQTSLFPNAAFEEEDGEPVLVVQGDADNRFSRHQNRQSTDPSTSSGVRPRTRGATETRPQRLVRGIRGPGCRLWIKLGERAKKVREGK